LSVKKTLSNFSVTWGVSKYYGLSVRNIKFFSYPNVPTKCNKKCHFGTETQDRP